MHNEVIDLCDSPNLAEEIANYDREIAAIISERNELDESIDAYVQPRLYRITFLNSRLRCFTSRRNNLMEAERSRNQLVGTVPSAETLQIERETEIISSRKRSIESSSSSSSSSSTSSSYSK